MDSAWKTNVQSKSYEQSLSSQIKPKSKYAQQHDHLVGL